MKAILATTLTVSAFLVMGCSGSGGDCLDGDNCGNGGNTGSSDPAAVAAPVDGIVGPSCADTGKLHPGFGGVELTTIDRVDGVPNGDRFRMKPHSALVTEYSRVLGGTNNPERIAQDGSRATFGTAPTNWFLEPQASAVILNQAMSVGFQGCLKLTGGSEGGTADPKFAAAPTLETAKVECATWAKKFWSREATPVEIEACANVAVTDSLSETYGDPIGTRTTTPERRWAYACASVLTTPGFLSY